MVLFLVVSVSTSDEAAAGCACALFMSKPAEKRRGFLDQRKTKLCHKQLIKRYTIARLQKHVKTHGWHFPYMYIDCKVCI